VVPRRDEGRPPQNGGDGDNIDDWPWLGLIQLLRSALTRVPAADRNLKFTLSLALVCKTITKFITGSCLVCTLFASTGHIMACHAVTCSQVHSRRGRRRDGALCSPSTRRWRRWTRASTGQNGTHAACDMRGRRGLANLIKSLHLVCSLCAGFRQTFPQSLPVSMQTMGKVYIVAIKVYIRGYETAKQKLLSCKKSLLSCEKS
jgi:hypothetical protein